MTAPTYRDNASNGLGVSALWQSGGQVWKNVSSSYDAGAWQAQPKCDRNIADYLGTSCVFAGGLVRMVSEYQGPAVSLWVTIRGVQMPCVPISITSGGCLDGDAVGGLVARADPGTPIYVATLFDQTGNGNHAQIADNNPLRLVWDVNFRSWAIVGDPTTPPPQALEFPVGVSLNGQNFGIFAIGTPTFSADNGAGLIATIGQIVGGVGDEVTLETYPSGSLQKWSNDNSTRVPTPSVPMDSSGGVVSMICTPEGTMFGMNDTLVLDSAIPISKTYYRGWIGRDHATSRCLPIRLIGLAVANAAPTTEVAQCIRESVYSRFNLSPQTRDQVLMLGDSRFAGAKTEFRYTVACHLSDALKKPCRVYNCGNGSQTSKQIISVTLPYIPPAMPGARTIAVVLAGINDYIEDGASASSVFDYLSTICSSLRSSGYVVILIPELHASNPSYDSFMESLRSLIVANPSVADHIANVASITPVASPSNPAFYPDGLHLSSALSQLIASYLAPIIDSI